MREEKNVTAHHRNWHWSMLGIVSSCLLTVSCASSFHVQTKIHESSEGSIYLEWVPDDAFRASHPASVTSPTIRRILSGIQVQERRGLLKLIAGQDQEPMPMFSEYDVAFLTSHIVTALSKATPEEQVVFNRIYPSDSTDPVTAKGALHIYGDLVYLTVMHYQSRPKHLDVYYTDNRYISAPARADPSGLKDRTISFTPTAALQPSPSPQSALGEPQTRTFVIDPVLLAKLPSSPPATVTTSKTEQPQQSSGSSSSAGQSSREARKDAEMEDTLRSLQRKLSKIETEMERLKEKK